MLTATNLKCEYLQNPIGIGEKTPRFSWIIESDRQNVLQESYRLQIAKDPEFESTIWDTGKVLSQDSVHVVYDGPSLESCTRYYFRVMITDNHNQESPWSDTAYFETALFDNSEWKAEFITSSEDSIEKPAKGKLFRREFHLTGEVEAARVYATALGLYELYINGKRVGDAVFAPGWTDYDNRLQYQTYDVTELLSQGENAVGAIVGGGWYIGNKVGWLSRKVDYGNRMALLMEIRIKYTDGREEIVLTDGNWKCSDGPIVCSEFYNGELYDASLEQVGWDMPDFNDSSWESTEILMFDKDKLVPQDGLFVRKHETIKPVSMFTTSKGEKVIDFGQNLAGWVRFTVNGKAGDRVVLKHAEVLDSDGNFYTDNLRSAEAKVEYILKGGQPETFEPHFTFQGFRYIRIDEYPGEPKLEDFVSVALYSDMEPTGSFSCSNVLINQLQHNILWGLKSNFVDIPTDCPQRDERLGWTGDAQVFIRTACFLMGVEPFFKKWLRDMQSNQLEDGGIPHVIPDVLTNSLDKGSTHFTTSACGWGDAATICPWTIYQCYGDKGLLREQYPMMKRWVEYIRGQARDEVIWDTGFHFGDWVALDAPADSCTGATSKDFLATAFYAYSTEILAKSAVVLGLEEDAAEYEKLYSKILKTFKDEFYTPNGRLAEYTQTAHVLALAFGLAPEEYKKRTINDLAGLIEESNGCITTGFLGTPYICHVLSQNGRADLAYKLLMREEYPSWLYPITKGATTIWEHWDGIKPDGSMWSPDMNSFNHYAFGAIGDFLYRVVAGIDIDPDKPGYKHILVHPMPCGGLRYARAELNSVQGRVSVDWKIEDKKMLIKIVVPHNSTAHIILPNAKASEVESSAGMNVALTDCQYGAEGELGSGEYCFSYPYIK